MEARFFHLDSMDANYANLEGINAISNRIHRSTKDWLPKTGWCSGSRDPATMHRHT